MSRVHVFTSAAFNYIPNARLLFSALRRLHPEWTLHLALGDQLNPEFRLDSEPFDEIMPLADLGIPHWNGWTFCHSIVELCTAIKPFVLRQLLDRDDCEKVFYFDPDIVPFSRLDDLVETLNSANIVLTPHQIDPEMDLEAVIDNEICSLRHGVYNLGFIGVRNSHEGRRFAEWWASRAYHFCRADIPNGLFTDQRWIDLVPAFFEGVAVMRSHRHNVATWNITTRNLSGGLETGLVVDGEPLGFYHFTGFESGAHAVMAKKYAGGSPAVFELIRWYEQQIKNLGQDPVAKVRWAYDTFSNGEKISYVQRIVYRQRLDLQAAYPDPFDAGGYLKWWKSTAAEEYPELGDKGNSEGEVRKVASMLVFGFCAGAKPFENRSLGDLWSMKHVPQSGFSLLAANARTTADSLSTIEAARQRIAVAERGRRAAEYSLHEAERARQVAQALAQQRQSTIDALYASTSWRSTVALRYLSRLILPSRRSSRASVMSSRGIIHLRYSRQFLASLKRYIRANIVAGGKLLVRPLVPPHLRPLARQVNGRNTRIALRYIRRGQFKALHRHMLYTLSRLGTAGTALRLVVPRLSSSIKQGRLRHSTDIIIPVYNGMDFLPKLFDSILRNTSAAYRLIIIDDASPDERVWPYLQEVSAKCRSAILLRNDKNHGFVWTCNRAMELTRNHFVICNTDIEVPPGWLERLMAPIYEESNVATVTPFTNAGTICSFPIFVQDNEILHGWPVEAIDSLFAHIAEPSSINMPTGVGFCMAFNRRAVKEVGYLDAHTFKRGYGEENEWCIRASARGYVHRMATNLFVYHKHGGSFIGPERERLLESNFRKLVERHPEYQSVVSEFILRDPAKELRNFLLLYVVAHLAKHKTVLIVDHALGGGANLYRKQLLQQYIESGRPILLLTYEYHTKRMRLEFLFQEHKVIFVLQSLNDLNRLSRAIPLDEVIYNNAVSYSDPLAVVETMRLIKKDTGAKLIVSFHDYFPVCPSYTLINAEGRHCGVPDTLRTCDRCLAESQLELVGRPDGGIAQWRGTWGALIADADTVLCFSENAARLVHKVYPQAAPKTVIRPHKVDYLPHRLPQVDLNKNVHIGIFGDISYAKGAEVVRRIAEAVNARKIKIRLTVVGTIWYEKKPPLSVNITGPYEKEKLAEIIEREKITICLLPSIWPETFSYVTEELMQLKMPLCCFDLGAPADRVRSYPLGRILSSIGDPDAALDEIIEFYEELRRRELDKKSVEFSVAYSDKPISGAMHVVFHNKSSGAEKLLGRFSGGREFVREIGHEGAGEFSIGVNSHLLPNGPVEASFTLLDKEGTCLWSGETTVIIDNTSVLAERVRGSMISWGTPLIVEKFDASQYNYADKSLAAWFDRPDANEHIEKMLEGDVISGYEAEMLRAFVVDGFVVIEDAIEEALIERVNREMDDLAEKKLQGYTEGSSQRIEGLHLIYPGVRELWQHPTVMRILELIFNAKPRPCQTLTYLFGSQQDAHQDTIHLTPFPAGYMCGVWVAMEDVKPNSGELEVFRGSHRLPRVYMRDCECAKVIDKGWVEFAEKVGGRWASMISENMPERILHRPRRGTVLIWHENLMHAGSKRVDMTLSRRSIVSHLFADGAVAFYDSTGKAGYMHPVDRAASRRPS